jgi:ribonuclease HI
MLQPKIVDIFTDGACSGNPGRGGYGALLQFSGKEQELSQGYLHTTNNRMELRGVIAALSSLKEPCQVNLYCDSEYVIKAVSKGWLDSWRKNSWRKSDKKPVANRDLWQELLPLLEKHQVKFNWVRGHSGHSENERCDALAVAASQSREVIEDSGFVE